MFPRYTALDGIGPYEVLSRIPGFEVTFIGHERGVVRSDNGILGIAVDATFEEVPSPGIVVFPGGNGTRELVHDERLLEWVRRAHETTTYTTSVCTGSLVLAAAGLLEGPAADPSECLTPSECRTSIFSGSSTRTGPNTRMD